MIIVTIGKKKMVLHTFIKQLEKLFLTILFKALINETYLNET